jgi:SAM-dependent methyltransferase
VTLDSPVVPAPDEAATDPAAANETTPSAFDAGRLFGRWYYGAYTVPYIENEHWQAFFGQVADAIVTQLGPRTVLDVGCAKGFLVAALRERGVDATGFDISEVAIAEAPSAARPHVRVGSLTEPIEGRYDLVTCLEVIEHLDPSDAPGAVANLSGASDRLLLSSTPGDLDEPTHVNIQPPERWSQLCASHGLFRDFHHDAGYVSPWAVLYRREPDKSVADVVLDYDRAWFQLRAETIEQRKSLLDLQERMERSVGRNPSAEEAELRKEILRLRDLVVGAEGQVGTAKARIAELTAMLERYTNLEQRLNDMLKSRSWRLMWAVGRPVRKFRSID